MNVINLIDDIKVFYIEAKSFPEGILEAHQKLHSLIPYSTERKYFGIARPENGSIVYRAAAEELKRGDAEAFGCDTLILKKGRYVNLTINDYMKNIPQIGKAFEELLTNPEIGPQGYCVEWYINNKDVKCMVRLKD
ncbi:transcriptional regulator [Solitalea lacus]|uniref:transcriptional regulator n=1 Tax=Solitalea lacus TaxID=2911172 RepID=UPI001EDC5E1A|nr:transcriptional regulator [Solitalea lacus]UKJ08769.1 transcriptional regulator [Solitalea lacus]